jgi:oligoendopeptidase F
MLEDLKGIDLDAFRALCERVLRDTEDTYLMLLDEQLKRYPGVTRENFYRHDTSPLFRSERFAAFFPGDSMLPGAARTFAAMGVPLGSMENLHIDAEPRETKNPRAVCFPIDVPSDVRLSIKPTGGTDDYSALYHEIGHGLHFANTREHAVEFKYMGEPTVTETFAFLSEYIFSNQAWLRQHTRMKTDALKDYVRFHAFYRLYFIRRYSAKFLYELRLHSGSPSPEKSYTELLSRATGYIPIPSDEKRYLTDLDALYYSAGYLRAWFLEAQLSTRLSDRYGANWFENPEAGEYLKSLWATGDRLNGDELAATLGYDGIHPDELLAKVNAMMLFSTR